MQSKSEKRPSHLAEVSNIRKPAAFIPSRKENNYPYDLTSTVVDIVVLSDREDLEEVEED
jgi:hypothetical protein